MPACGGRALRAAAGLHLVATPIGNLGDITLRALCGAAQRRPHPAARTPGSPRGCSPVSASTTPLDPYHDHNADRVRPAVLAALRRGETLALVSDAGTPLVSDPGYKLVRDGARRGPAGDRGARPFGGVDRADPVGPAARRVPVRRVSAAAHGGAPARARAAGQASPRRWCSSRARRGSPTASPTWRRCSATGRPRSARELTKRHEEMRRGRSRSSPSIIAAPAAARRDRDRRRPARAAARRTTRSSTRRLRAALPDARACATRSPSSPPRPALPRGALYDRALAIAGRQER